VKIQQLNARLIQDSRFHFSILAKKSAQLYFTQDNYRMPLGLMIVFDGWGPHHNSTIRFCNLIRDDDYPQQCREHDTITVCA
jgi:hypothetical protein